MRDRDLNITRIGGDLTSAAADGFGDVDIARVGLDEKDLIGKQTSADVARVGQNVKLCGVAAIKAHVARASLDRELFRCDHVFQMYNLLCSLNPIEHNFLYQKALLNLLYY